MEQIAVALVTVAFLTFVLRVVAQIREQLRNDLQERQRRPGKYIRRFETWTMADTVIVLRAIKRRDLQSREDTEPLTVRRAA
jgi:hypothetical protein